jgi:exopolysaccharide production protein ExoZ
VYVAKGQLDSIQVLRGVAAVAVVIYHAVISLTLHLPSDIVLPPAKLSSILPFVNIGAAGVDVFFVLSGFLMVYIAGPYVSGKRSVGHFVAQRLVRIWPPYAAITLAVCIMLLRHEGTGSFDLQPRRLLSFLLIPSFNSRGDVSPILGVGWTLYYEAMFYAVFAFVLSFSTSHLLLGLVSGLGSIFLVGWLLPSNWALHQVLTDPVMFEFLLGGVVALWFSRKKIPFPHPMLWIGVGLLMFAIFGGPTQRGLMSRLFEQGIAAATIFCGVLLLQGRVRWPRWFLLVGDASYSIYLIHLPLIYYVAQPWARRASRAGASGGFVYADVGATILLSICVGVACYRFLETPLLDIGHALIRRFDRRSKSPAPDKPITEPVGEG